MGAPLFTLSVSAAVVCMWIYDSQIYDSNSNQSIGIKCNYGAAVVIHWYFVNNYDSKHWNNMGGEQMGDNIFTLPFLPHSSMWFAVNWKVILKRQLNISNVQQAIAILLPRTNHHCSTKSRIRAKSIHNDWKRIRKLLSENIHSVLATTERLCPMNI